MNNVLEQRQKIELGRIEVSEEDLAQMVKGAVVDIHGGERLVVEGNVVNLTGEGIKGFVRMVGPSPFRERFLRLESYDVVKSLEGSDYLCPQEVVEFNKTGDSLRNPCRHSRGYDGYVSDLNEVGIEV